MLKWMVTSARGRGEGDEVSLAESQDDNDVEIFTITRQRPRTNPMYVDDTLGSRSSGYSSAGGHNLTTLPRNKQSLRRGKNSQKDEIPSPIWPKYVGGGASEDGATNKGVQIMKERWFQQRKNTTGIVTDDKDDERDDNIAIGDMSQRKIGTIYTWLEGVSVSQRESSHGSRVTNYHGDSDHEYLVPRPMSSVSGDSNYSHEDVDRVMKQISIAVSKSRGVSSLSRAVAKNSTTTSISTSNRTPINRDKYPYKVCSASLPRPKLKRLKSNSQNPKNSHPRPGPASAKNKETHINIDRDRVFGVMENTDLGHDHHHVNNRSRSSKDVTMTQNNYYNLYGSPIPSGPLYNSNHSPAFILARKDNFRLSYYQQPYSLLADGRQEKKQRKMMAMFCKSLCFILLFLSFIMVLVTVSIFLSKGIKPEVSI